MKNYILILVFILSLGFISCEKEITVDLPPATPSLVVEASINQSFPNLNYVFITRTLDYFNPDVSLYGVKGAIVYITPGFIKGADTLYDINERVLFSDIAETPGVEQFLNGFSGIYFNPTFAATPGIPYKLEIEVDGQFVTGVTTIPSVVQIDTVYYRQEIDKQKGDTNMYVTLEFTDGPEQNNYRLFRYKSFNPLLIGWGSADFSRLFDDAILNNGRRPYSFFSPLKYNDTLNLYLTSIGRKEYQFWVSYANASRNGGPYSTPVTVEPNITGAIGSFTGYGVSYRRIILQ